LAVVFVLVLLPCATALAAPADPVDGPPQEWDWNYGSAGVPWARVIGGTTLVVGLVCVGVYLVKKLGGGALLRKGRYMELLETRVVGRRLQLFLVRVAGRIVLIASSGDHVTQVAEFPEGELADLQPAGQATAAEGFRGLFKKLAGVQQ
jgi:flagellar biogenesis protein FliO